MGRCRPPSLPPLAHSPLPRSRLSSISLEVPRHVKEQGPGSCLRSGLLLVFIASVAKSYLKKKQASLQTWPKSSSPPRCSPPSGRSLVSAQSSLVLFLFPPRAHKRKHIPKQTHGQKQSLPLFFFPSLPSSPLPISSRFPSFSRKDFHMCEGNAPGGTYYMLPPTEVPAPSPLQLRCSCPTPPVPLAPVTPTSHPFHLESS